MLFLSKSLYIISEVRMQSISEKARPKYLIDEKGKKKLLSSISKNIKASWN